MAVDLSPYKSLYIQTAKEYSNILFARCVALSRNAQDRESINRIYIAAHSLRTQSEVMGYTKIASLSGSIENITKKHLDAETVINREVLEAISNAASNLYFSSLSIENGTGELSLMIASKKLEEAYAHTGAISNGEQHKMKALLIEDDRFFQKFYSTKLKEQNIDVDVASDGEEGLQKMREEAPSVVLLDLIMPKKDGFSVLKDRQLDENLKKIPVIVFSTLGQEKDLENARQLGGTDYVNKSFFNFDEIMVKISKYK